MNVKVATLGSL